MRVISPCVIIAVLVLYGTLSGHQIHEGRGFKNLGLDEKTGRTINLDAAFIDEEGRAVTMRAALTRPTLLLPIYYRCTDSCGMMLGDLASSLNDVSLTPGKDYNVLALSIDAEDTPAIARRTRDNYSRILKKDFPPGSWRYLTGTGTNILLLTDSLGFKFVKTAPHTFVHPNALIVLGKDGTVIRYLYGPLFLPFDISMALTEAERGTPSLSIRKVASYCFTYDPKKKTYGFSAVRYIGAGVLVILGIILFLVLRKKESR